MKTNYFTNGIDVVFPSTVFTTNSNKPSNVKKSATIKNNAEVYHECYY